LDITKLDDVIEFVENEKPDCIVNCAAYTAVDKAEEMEELAERINAEGPRNLAIAADKVDAILVHISTDYVFDGELELSDVYVETDKVAPVTAYGRTKAHGEQFVVENMDKYYIFRTAWLYGEGNNFVQTMLTLGKDKDEINVVADQHGSPTNADDLANYIAEALEKKIPYGIYHATNAGFTTWYGFTQKIFELANINCKVNPVTSDEFVRPAKRPSNSKLSKDKLIAQGIEVPTWEEALERYLSEGREEL